jgi:hypothetical protein
MFSAGFGHAHSIFSQYFKEQESHFKFNILLLTIQYNNNGKVYVDYLSIYKWNEIRALAFHSMIYC